MDPLRLPLMTAVGNRAGGQRLSRRGCARSSTATCNASTSSGAVCRTTPYVTPARRWPTSTPTTYAPFRTCSATPIYARPRVTRASSTRRSTIRLPRYLSDSERQYAAGGNAENGKCFEMQPPSERNRFRPAGLREGGTSYGSAISPVRREPRGRCKHGLLVSQCGRCNPAPSTARSGPHLSATAILRCREYRSKLVREYANRTSLVTLLMRARRQHSEQVHASLVETLSSSDVVLLCMCAVGNSTSLTYTRPASATKLWHAGRIMRERPTNRKVVARARRTTPNDPPPSCDGETFESQSSLAIEASRPQTFDNDQRRRAALIVMDYSRILEVDLRRAAEQAGLQIVRV